MKKLTQIVATAAGIAAVALSAAFNTSAAQTPTMTANVQLAGSIQGASNPPPGIRPGQCWHAGHGQAGFRSAMQWIDSWIAPCGSPGARGPV